MTPGRSDHACVPSDRPPTIPANLLNPASFEPIHSPQTTPPMFGLLPRNLEFFDLFEQAAANALGAAEVLAELSVSDPRRHRDLIESIKEREHIGDKLTHDTLDRLQTTYLTPIDREDIYGLSKLIDDFVDRIHGVAQRLATYRLGVLTEGFREQCRILVEAARLTSGAVARLRHLKSRRARLNGPTIEELIIAIHAPQHGRAGGNDLLAADRRARNRRLSLGSGQAGARGSRRAAACGLAVGCVKRTRWLARCPAALSTTPENTRPT